MFRILICFFLALIVHRTYGGANDPPERIVVEGRTMGTTYRIVYFDEPRRRDFQTSIDSLLRAVNSAINTYDPDSEISRFNTSRKGVRVESPFFHEILQVARRVYDQSGGAFDPTVMPLVNAWGFGPQTGDPPTAQAVDSLRQMIGFNKVRFNKKRVRKREPRVQLDMGGIGQGYGADVIFRFLQSKGIEHMLVELGGEGLAFGRNLAKDHDWTIGILDPRSTPQHQFFKAYVGLRDQAFTTSGNYFNYKVVNGRKYGHTINPSTGYPVQHSLLSASVFADDCTTADAWATAFMVMGTERAINMIEATPGLDAIFLYSEEDGAISTYVSAGIRNQVILE